MTFRERVLRVVEAAQRPLSSREIAVEVGLTRIQTISALGALYNYGRITRIGSKSSSMWMRLQAPRTACPLQAAMQGWMRKR